MPSRPWYKWFPADYAADTRLLTLEQDAFYRRLLDAFWTLGPLPNDPKAIGLATHLGTQKAAHLVPHLAPYLDTLPDGRLTHWRIEEQRAQAIEVSEKRAAAGAIGGRANAKAHALAKGGLRARVPDPEKEPPKPPASGGLVDKDETEPEKPPPRSVTRRQNGKLRRMSDVALVSLCQSRKIPTRGKTRDELLASLEECE